MINLLRSRRSVGGGAAVGRGGRRKRCDEREVSHARVRDKGSSQCSCRFRKWSGVSGSCYDEVNLGAVNAGAGFKLVGVAVLLTSPRVQNCKAKLRKKLLEPRGIALSRFSSERCNAWANEWWVGGAGCVHVSHD